jgi:hypothetical protein
MFQHNRVAAKLSLPRDIRRKLNDPASLDAQAPLLDTKVQ